MSQRLLLDTDVVVDLLRGHPNATVWAATVSPLPFLSGIAALEVSFGSRSLAQSKRASIIISDFAILWPNEDDIKRATHELSLLSVSQGIGPIDAVIAAQAIRLNMPLATFNVKHFRAVPGLVLVQPYTR